MAAAAQPAHERGERLLIDEVAGRTAQWAVQRGGVTGAGCRRASQARPAVCSRRSCCDSRRTVTAGRRPVHSFGRRYKQGGRAERPEQATAPPHRRPPAKSSESGRRHAGGGPLARGVDSLWQRRRSRRMREASGCAWMRRLAVPPSGRYSGVGSLGRGAGVLRKPGRRCALRSCCDSRRTAGRRPAYSFGLRYEQGGRAERPEQATAPRHRRPPAKSSESGRRCAGGGPLARGVDSLWQRRRSRHMREAGGCALMRLLAVPPSGRYSGVGSLGRGAGVLLKPGRWCAAGALAATAGGARRTAGRRPAYSFGRRYKQGGRAEQATAPPHRPPACQKL